MVSRLHNRLGTAGFVVAIIALVVAMAGTAFAVAGLNGKQKREVTKISKKVAKQTIRKVVGPAGPAGAAGATGAPWPAGGTLPSGATQTGSWGSYYGTEGVAAISFPIPLAAPLDATHVKQVDIGDPLPAECDNGSGAAASPSNPEADPGFLCVFATYTENGGKIVNGLIVDPANLEAGTGSGKFGASVFLEASPGPGLLLGSFAVTAP